MYITGFEQVQREAQAARELIQEAGAEADRCPGDVALQRQWAAEMHAIDRATEVITKTAQTQHS